MNTTPLTLDELERADRLTARHTAWDSLCLMASDPYTPTLRDLELADLYDRYQAERFDTRRAFRG